MGLRNKVALVTGSTSGIGLGIARAFAREGADLMMNGFGPQADIDAEVSRIKSEFGVKCVHSPADMTKPDEIREMVRQAQETLGSVDVLVNNAGIQFVSPIEDFPDEKFEAIIRINLLSAFYTIKAALPRMKERRWGRVINIASTHALVASPFKSAYVAAKHGIAGLTKTVALEAATHGVTVNAIAPGYVWTPLVANQVPDTAKARGLTEEQVKRDVLLAAQPTKEFVTIDQVAALAVFLTSEPAASITGAVLPIDGGWTAA